MKIFRIGLMFLFLLSCSKQIPDYEALSFELRLAQAQADSNLQEMYMHNSDMKFYVGDSVFLRNSNIKSTEVLDINTHPKILATLNEEGAEKFADFTGSYIGENAAILVGGKLVSAPRINAKIGEGKLIITGYFNLEEAEKIAIGILINNE